MKNYRSAACTLATSRFLRANAPVVHQSLSPSQVLAESVVGASKEQGEADEDVDSQPPPAAQDGGESSNRYEVVGTLRDGHAGRPKWVAEVVQVRMACEPWQADHSAL